MGLIGVHLRGVHMAHDHMGHSIMGQEVFDWLTEHVGLGSRAGGWIPDCDWLWCWNGNNFQQAVVTIQDPERAMVFKLTWGGA